MKNFNSGKKNYSRQFAMAYIVYMMAGSYFSSGSATPRIQKLYLHYAEMPRETQCQLEARVISSMEALDKRFLKKIAALRCGVRCGSCDGDILLEFYTGGFESLQCRIRKDCTFQLAPQHYKGRQCCIPYSKAA